MRDFDSGNQSGEIPCSGGVGIHAYGNSAVVLVDCRSENSCIRGVGGVKGEGSDECLAALVAGEFGAVERYIYGCAVEVDTDSEADGVVGESSVDSDVLLADDIEGQSLFTGQGVVVLRYVGTDYPAAVNFDGAQLHAHEREFLKCEADGLVVNFGDSDVPGNVRTDGFTSQSDIEQALVLAGQLLVYGVCDVGIVSSAGDCFREIGSCCYTVLCCYSECH